MSGEAYGQPFPVEVLRTCELPVHHCGHRRARLPRADPVRQIAQQHGMRQCMQVPGPVGYGPSDYRVGPFRGDHHLQQGGKSLFAQKLPVEPLLRQEAMSDHYAHHVGQHGVDHEAVVEVHVHLHAVAEDSVSLVPSVVDEAVYAVAETPGVAFSGVFEQRRLDHRGEEQPVGLVRYHAAAALPFVNQILLRVGVEPRPYPFASAQHAFSEKGCVHERLCVAASEGQVVRRFRIHGVAHGCRQHFYIFCAQPAFRSVVGAEAEPGAETAYGASESFQTRGFKPSGRVAAGFERHVPLEGAGREVAYHRSGYPVEHSDPLLSVASGNRIHLVAEGQCRQSGTVHEIRQRGFVPGEADFQHFEPVGNLEYQPVARNLRHCVPEFQIRVENAEAVHRPAVVGLQSVGAGEVQHQPAVLDYG